MEGTLQEGALASRAVIQFRGSLGAIGILHKLVEKLRHDVDHERPVLQDFLIMLFSTTFGKQDRVNLTFDREPLTGYMAKDLLRVVRSSLDEKSRRDYPRSSMCLSGMHVPARS